MAWSQTRHVMWFVLVFVSCWFIYWLTAVVTRLVFFFAQRFNIDFLLHRRLYIPFASFTTISTLAINCKKKSFADTSAKRFQAKGNDLEKPVKKTFCTTKVYVRSRSFACHIPVSIPFFFSKWFDSYANTKYKLTLIPFSAWKFNYKFVAKIA